MKEKRPPLPRPLRTSSILNTFLTDRGLTGKLNSYRVWKLWPAIVGPQIAARTQPLRLRDQVLEVRVDHPVWMQQLQLMKPQLLQRLNQQLGNDTIKDIYLRRGRLTPEPSSEVDNAPPPLHNAPPVTASDRARIETTLNTLHDPDLKDGLRHIFELQSRLNRLREDKASR